MSDLSRKRYINDKVHIGAFFIALGVIFLFAGADESLSIANNYYFFLAAIIANLVEFLFNTDKPVRISPVFVASALIVILLDIYHISFGSVNSGAMISILFYIVLVTSVILCRYSYRDAKIISDGVILSSEIFTFLIIFHGRELYAGSAKYTFIQDLYINRFGESLVFEPNFIASLMLVGFCMAVYHLIGPVRISHGLAGRIYYLIACGIILFGVMMTGSRSAMVSIGFFGLSIFLLMDNGPTKRRLWMLAAAGVILLIIMAVIGIIPQSIYLRMFSASYIDDSNLKRIKDWIYGLRVMALEPLLGNGPVLTADAIMNKYGFDGDAHNTFLTVGIMYGVPLFLLFIYQIVMLMRRSYKKRDSVMTAMMIAMVFEWNILPCQFTVGSWMALIIMMIMTDDGYVPLTALNPYRTLRAEGGINESLS